MFRSATLRLTMWYLALAMAISLAFSVVLYHVTTNELSHGLRRETQRIYSEFPNLNPALPIADGEYDISAHNIWVRLVGFNIIVFVGSGFASYLLAKRTLGPIELAHEQQKRFTADVSHELRTPLTAIRMESEVALLNKKSSADKLRETLESNLEETSKLEALINNLLKIANLESGKLQQNFVPVSVGTIALQAAKQVKAIASKRKIDIKIDVGDVYIDGNEESLTQLLVILLDNAIKYSPKQSKVVVTSTHNFKDVVINVIDSGVGIDKQSLDKVFDRFYRADASRSKLKTEGSGLGLSIAKSIADLHNGEITISSEPGHGTTVSVRLSRRRV